MNDNELLNKTRKALDNSIDSLDGTTLSRLNQARQKSLDSKQRTPSLLFGWLPASGFAALTIAIFTGWLWMGQTAETNINNLTSSFEDIEILSSNTEFELLEDMDFVSWLVEEEIMEPNNAG
jgi:type VI protein secretion system component VasF